VNGRATQQVDPTLQWWTVMRKPRVAMKNKIPMIDGSITLNTD